MFFKNRKKASEDSVKPVMVQCRAKVDRSAVSRKTIDGIEHVVVKSSTLPDNVVMNGGLYPAEEIEKSFESLERTFAPVEHPQVNGEFISAADPVAIHNFHAGAFNVNVQRKDGRVHIEKFINVAEAMKTDRGKRLLDRINELETNDNPRPIHTSVGVFLIPEELDEPVTNAEGAKATWIARDMVFDHDAILLDSVGAATPEQGVGIAVNHKGEECQVYQFELKSQSPELEVSAEGMSFGDIRESIQKMLESSRPMMPDDELLVVEIYPDDSTVIYSLNGQFFEVPYVLNEQGIATVVGIPLPVERNVTFTPKTNQSEGNAMKDLILNALNAAGVEVDGLNDDQLLDAYNSLKANQSESDDSGARDEHRIADVVANALKPLADQIESLQAKMNSQQQDELSKLADVVAGSGKYPGLDAESAKQLGVNKLKELAANCQDSFGVSPLVNLDRKDDTFSAPVDLPE